MECTAGEDWEKVTAGAARRAAGWKCLKHVERECARTGISEEVRILEAMRYV